MKINWKKPTKYSMIIAIILYLATFALAFYLGQMWGASNAILIECSNSLEEKQITSAFFTCDNEKTINAIFFSDKAELSLSDGRNMILFSAISASGARYANQDESFVFWNKGNTAFIQEGDDTTYSNCLTEN
ncbi:MAG: MliC family protein [Candidatus Pacebacteria bacterium]|nr:MliC family protein [Candidatus Paceibacterota bacterium]